MSERLPFGTIGNICRKSPPKTTILPPKGRLFCMKNVKAGSREMTESKVPKIGVGNKWSGKIVDEGGFGKSMFMLDVHLQVI